MADEPKEETKEEEPTEETVEKELEALKEDLEKPEEAPETPEATDEKVSDFDITEAARAHIATLSREDQVDIFKKLGHEVAPARQIQAEKEEIAEEAERLTMEQEMAKYRKVVPESDLPPGFYEADPQEQNNWLAFRTAEIVGKQMNDAEMAPIRQYQQAQVVQQELDATAVSWAKETGADGAAPQIRELLGTLSPDQVEMLRTELSSGGGAMVDLVSNRVRVIADEFTRAAEKQTEKPLPASEDVGGGESEGDVSLTGDAKTFYNQAKADPDFPDSELAGLAKDLAKA